MEERKRFAEEAERRMEAEFDRVTAHGWRRRSYRYLNRYAAKRMRLDYFKAYRAHAQPRCKAGVWLEADPRC